MGNLPGGVILSVAYDFFNDYKLARILKECGYQNQNDTEPTINSPESATQLKSIQ